MSSEHLYQSFDLSSIEEHVRECNMPQCVICDAAYGEDESDTK